MKQRNDSKLDVFNPFLGLQPMLSPRSRTLPPIKRSSRDFRTSKVYPSRIPVRIPFPKEKQQRKMAFLDGEVNPGNAFPKFSPNFQRSRNRLCANTIQSEDEWVGKKPEKEAKNKYFLDENSEKIHGTETSSFPSYGVQHHFSDNFGGKMSQEKNSRESDLRLIKSSSWANSIDDRRIQMNETLRTENSFQKEPSITNEVGEKRTGSVTKRHTRSLGRHLQPLRAKLTEYPEVKVRGQRGNNNTSLSVESPPSVVIDAYQGSGDFEVENEKFLEDEKRVSTERNNIYRRHRTLETVEEKRPSPVKRKTQSVTEKNTGIPCKPRLHKIQSLPLTPTKQTENTINFRRM